MSAFPLVSIVTPSYNSGDFLEQAIKSVLQQTYPRIEHIIFDGGSTDSTLEILNRYDHLIWTSEPDRGQADALNKGFARANGQIIGWLNADDTYEPNAIAEAVSELQKYPTADLVCGSFSFIDETGKSFYTHSPPPFSPEKLLYGNVLPNASLFLRRRVIDEVGGIRLDLHHVLDWEFVLRIGLRNKVRQIPNKLGSFRITAGTKSVEHPEHFWPEIIPIIDQHATSNEALSPFRDDALFWAKLFGGLEFARQQQPDAARLFIVDAFDHYKHLKSPASPDQIAFAIVETATRPWHRGFREHPRARQALIDFVESLDRLTIADSTRGYIQLYLGVTQFMGLHWTKTRAFLQRGVGTARRYGIGRSMQQALLYGILGTNAVTTIRKLKPNLKSIVEAH